MESFLIFFNSLLIKLPKGQNFKKSFILKHSPPSYDIIDTEKITPEYSRPLNSLQFILENKDEERDLQFNEVARLAISWSRYNF